MKSLYTAVAIAVASLAFSAQAAEKTAQQN
jgi:hypothetical protein